MGDDCEYKHDIEQLKTDRTRLQEQYKDIKEDLSEIKHDLKNIIHNGIIDQKVEAAVSRLFLRFLLAAAGSGGIIAAIISWLSNAGL